MWVLKIKGQSHYVTHVTVKPNVGMTTKETPDNAHTKGAIKFKGSVRIFTNDGGEPEAEIY